MSELEGTRAEAEQSRPDLEAVSEQLGVSVDEDQLASMLKLDDLLSFIERALQAMNSGVRVVAT